MFLRYDILSDDIGLYSNYNLSYSPSGRIGNKTCDDMLWDYWYGYKKGNNGSLMSHQVRSIYDLYSDNTSFLQWNADGQLQAVVRPCTGDMRHHWWNEAGQLIASIDNASCGYYGYDGNGNRAYKLTGQSAQDQYNAGEWQYHVNFNDAVLYVNPYFIVTPKGYTRHYYNGSQRIASQIGNILDLPTNIIDTSAVARERIANAQAYMASMLSATAEKIDISTGDIADIDGDELDELQWQCLDTNTITFRITLHSDTNMLFPALNRDAGSPANVLDIYYYHADHLGSASWITNKEGTPIEYIHYMPYGELWYNWQASSYNERFKFTGKERDAETGYDYFGARYYSSILGHWISVDPLLDEQSHITPYAYCKWSPINRLDPDGMIDYDMVKMGLSTMAIGGGTAVGGTMVGATGLGAPVGALLIVDGIAGVGIGASLFITGLLTDPNEQNTYIMNNIPTNATSAITKSADQIAGNEHHQIEYTVDGILIMAGGKPSFNDVKEFYAAAATLTQAIQLGNNIKKEILPAVPPIGSPLQNEGLPNDNTRVVSNYLDIRQYSIEYE